MEVMYDENEEYMITKLVMMETRRQPITKDKKNEMKDKPIEF